MIPVEAREFLLYYAGAIALAVLWFYRTRPKRRGMILKLKGSNARPNVGGGQRENVIPIDGNNPPDKFSHIQPQGERPLNVVFNYNGHSWDAYEVLGLPAGSGPEKVGEAYRESLKKVDPGSKGFIEAAHRAIESQWKHFRAAGGE